MWRKFTTAMTYVDRGVDRGISFIIIIGAIIMTLTIVLQVLLRYVFKWPLFGLEEFSRLVAVWLYFFGAALGTRDDGHVQGDVAARLFTTERSRALLKTITWTLGLVACLLLLYHSARYSLWLYGTGERTTGLWWPRVYSVGSMLVGAALMTIYAVANMIRNLESFIRYSAAPSGGEP